MTAALLPVSEADIAAFRQRDDTALIERLRQGLYVGIAVGIVLTPVTARVRPDLSPGYLYLPVVASGIMAAVSLATRLPGIDRVATPLCCGTSYAVATCAAFVAAKTDGFYSPYFLIHFLICTFATAFLPMSPRMLILTCLPNLLITAVIILLHDPPHVSILLPVLLSACGLVYAYFGVVLRSQADLQSFVAHTRLAETRASLADLNAELERRVELQVREIVQRADDIHALNAQLREKVQARSRELARALRALHHEPAALDVGAVLGGRVVIEGTLGAGGMGTVHVGHDRVSGRTVAVKVMSAHVLASPRAIQRFLAEAEAAAAIAHPGIVKTLHVDVTADGTPFLIMEYIEGAPLHLLARRAGKLAPGLVARLGEAIASALAAAHAVGIVHRDVKPSNVMISRELPAVRLLDFGVSKIDHHDDAGLAAPGLTSVGALLGTPAYMAPEQVRGSSAVTPACDIYSLGIVLHELAAGRHPFPARDGVELLVAHASEHPIPLDQLDPAIPHELARLVTAAIAKAPTARPTALELAEALGRLTADAPDPRSLLDCHHSTDVRAKADGITTVDRGLPGITATAP